MTHASRQRTAKWSVALLSLLVSLRCNVYDASLLGNGESPVGGTATIDHSGASGTTGGASAASGGVAGKPNVGAGGDSAGSSGLSDMAGAIETGGVETSGGGGARGGSAGKPSTTAGAAGVTAGAGGARGGTGGTTGAAGAAAGAGGAGAAAGAGGATQPASGCAKLSVPLDDTSDKAHFVISLTSPADLSAATISMRFYVQAGTGGTLFNYVQDSGTYHFLGVAAAQRHTIGSPGAWSTISWNVGAEPDSAGTGIVKTSIKNIGIELNAQPSSAWINPTVIFLDSITVTTPALSFTFDATSSVYPTPTTTSAPAQALWLNNGTSDTTASGATLSWLATCP